jgi:sugar/nucleoside kinase (ribokinase family)
LNGLLVHKLSAPSLIVTIGTHTIFNLLGANDGTLGLIEPLFPYIDYFMPRIEEARQISGAPDVEGAGRFFLERAFEIEVVEYDGLRRRLRCRLHHGPASQDGPGHRANLAQASAALVATCLGSDAGIRSFDETLAFMNSAPRKAA